MLTALHTQNMGTVNMTVAIPSHLAFQIVSTGTNLDSDTLLELIADGVEHRLSPKVWEGSKPRRKGSMMGSTPNFTAMKEAPALAPYEDAVKVEAPVEGDTSVATAAAVLADAVALPQTPMLVETPSDAPVKVKKRMGRKQVYLLGHHQARIFRGNASALSFDLFTPLEKARALSDEDKKALSSLVLNTLESLKMERKDFSPLSLISTSSLSEITTCSIPNLTKALQGKLMRLGLPQK